MMMTYDINDYITDIKGDRLLCYLSLQLRVSHTLLMGCLYNTSHAQCLGFFPNLVLAKKSVM